ncbi:nematocyst expressed protein 3-like [Schistocerca piceifrons]|uniref:nematocyst expressed protein 3-like n=1 Tax=Schistocerca piceifrons TaxID=274613 RepID=UPI001F5FE61E|nr:nematocyst expressed protein 3-like [Schistocerca piceifrons]
MVTAVVPATLRIPHRNYTGPAGASLYFVHRGSRGVLELEEARSPAAADVAAPVSASAAPTPGADSPSPAPEPEHLAPDASASATVPSSTSSCSASDEERGRSSDGGGGGSGGPVQTDPALCAASDDSPPAVAATLGLQGLLRVRALVAAAAIAASPDPPGAGAVTPESGGGSGPASSASVSAAAAAAVAAAGCWGGEERARIAEYLQRADTAVIFPEPVAEPGAEPETAAARADAESATGAGTQRCGAPWDARRRPASSVTPAPSLSDAPEDAGRAPAPAAATTLCF